METKTMNWVSMSPWLAVGLICFVMACSPNASVKADLSKKPAPQISHVSDEGHGMKDAAPVSQRIRVATFNTSLNRDEAGALHQELSGDNSSQAKAVAEIIQRVRPDIIAIQEFDYDPGEQSLQIFRDSYLARSQNGAPSQLYPYAYNPAVNTGMPSGVDLSGDGRSDGPGDAYGFGKHPGQYGFVLLSKFPILEERVRSFRMLLWKDMPGALLPHKPRDVSTPFHSEKALSVMRLSSKNHIDIPVRIGTEVLHLIIAHPTPPVFDGPEDRNGRRNHDEIRLIADYVSGTHHEYLRDDQGHSGSLSPQASFVVLGDLNADPVDGDSLGSAIHQVLKSPRIHPGVSLGNQIPQNRRAKEKNSDQKGSGDPTHHTADWGLRVDYVLPSRDLIVLDSGMFWPASTDPLYRLVNTRDGKPTSSDHRLVWLDLKLPGKKTIKK